MLLFAETNKRGINKYGNDIRILEMISNTSKYHKNVQCSHANHSNSNMTIIRDSIITETRKSQKPRFSSNAVNSAILPECCVFSQNAVVLFLQEYFVFN